MSTPSQRNTFSKLKFIACLEPGDKINTRYLIKQPEGIWTRFSRTLLNYDNRNNTNIFITNTVNEAIDFIDNHRATDGLESKMADILLTDLNNSKNGLNNIMNTYADDLKFKCDIMTLIQYIDTKLEEYGYNKGVVIGSKSIVKKDKIDVEE